MMKWTRQCVLLFCLPAGLMGHAAAQATWDVPYSEQRVLLDGRLDEWSGASPILVAPTGSAAQANGEFPQDEPRVSLRALWNKEGIFLAIEWQDDIWDIREISRRDAVWISPEGKRRDRMYFFDNLKLELLRRNFQYTLWLSPRDSERGPFFWHRLFGKKRLELGGGPPLMSSRLTDKGVILEVQLRWKDLKLKAKPYEDLIFSIDVADSDLPGKPPEAKVNRLRWLALGGHFQMRKDR